MLDVHRHDDVTQLELSSRRSRLAGYRVSAYVVRGALVDTGFPRAWRDLAPYLDAQPVRGVIITHQHEDHAGNAERLAQRGLPLGMATRTREMISRPRRIELYRRAMWGQPPLLETSAPPFDDDALTLIPTPGHSSDHQIVWDAERETLFSGDLFLGIKVRVAHPAERPRRTLASVRQALALAPQRMFCAHRGLVPDPTAALAAKAEWMAETIGRIDARIAEGWEDRAILGDVLGGEEPTGYLTAGEYGRMNFVRGVRAG